MEERIGSSMYKECPRAGYLMLWTTDDSIVVPTNCKTWRCLSCRDRVQGLLKSRIVRGCLLLGRSWLITVTFRTVGSARRTAASVAKVWAHFLRSLRKTYRMEPAWLRILEATKKGQPHIHMVMGNLPETLKTTCTGKTAGGRPNHRFDTKWLRKECICFEHVVARAWYEASGDSYVVDCRLVLGAAGAAAYMAKYLTKAVLSYETLYKLGFHRRWSRSRNWPGGGKLRLQATVDNQWVGLAWQRAAGMVGDRWSKWAKISEDHYLARRTGDNLSWKLEEKFRRKLTAKRLKGAFNESIRQKVRTS